MPGLLGKKIGMTSVFSADGKNVPCTVIEAGPCVVTQIKTIENDGYEAVQVGFMPKKEKHTTRVCFLFCVVPPILMPIFPFLRKQVFFYMLYEIRYTMRIRPTR